MAHFKVLFKPATDMIYGMGKWIHLYLYNFYFRWPKNLKPYSLELRGVDKQNAHDKYGKNVINEYNEPIKFKMFKPVSIDSGKKATMANTEVIKGEDPQWPTTNPFEDYFDALLGSKQYGPTSLLQPVPELLKSLVKYETFRDIRGVKEWQRKEDNTLIGTINDIAIRRSCKFGIDYFTSRPTGALHYLLDEMVIRDIVSKKEYENRTMKKSKVPICTSELRYMFRHWQELKKRRVRFYLAFQTTAAPWDNMIWSNCFPDWAAYANHRYLKYVNQIPPPVRMPFFIAYQKWLGSNNAGLAKNAIEAFHTIPSYMVNAEEEEEELEADTEAI